MRTKLLIFFLSSLTILSHSAMGEGKDINKSKKMTETIRKKNKKRILKYMKMEEDPLTIHLHEY